MNSYTEWARRHPDAALDLHALFNALPWPSADTGESEAYAQQQARFDIREQGALSFRNNVGATPSKCRHCGVKQQPTRYGLANDSAKLNKEVKSSDLILAIPRLIKPEDVGRTIAQFGAVETKKPGWHYRGDDHEAGQAAWLALIASVGGFACFSTGEVKL